MIRYEGQYVAIVGKSIVAHGKDAKKVYEIARKFQVMRMGITFNQPLFKPTTTTQQ